MKRFQSGFEALLWGLGWFAIAGAVYFGLLQVIRYFQLASPTAIYAALQLSFPVAGFVIAPFLGRRLTKFKKKSELAKRGHRNQMKLAVSAKRDFA